MTDNLTTYILTVNCGSSSLKFSLYHSLSTKLVWSGSVDQIGEKTGHFEISDSSDKVLETKSAPYPNMGDAVGALTNWFKSNTHDYPLLAIAHRLVQGGHHHLKPEIITGELLKTLSELVYLAPNHLPDEISTIKAFQSAFPGVKQIACYDTWFHRAMPSYARNYPLPAEYHKKGLVHYGFHGLSYEYIMDELAKEESPVAEQRIIIAHLGNGASMAAVRNGLSVDTTMGISPIGGLVMGTRSGDLDPGVLIFLLRETKMTVDELEDLLSKRSGLLAIAGTSDVQELLKMEPHSPKAAEALTVFCYSAKKFIGSLAAAMGGLDMLIFTGGIGENSTVIRERICKDLAFIGITLDKQKNLKNETFISCDSGKVIIRVMKTNEDLMMARLVCAVLNYAIKQ